jgi:hypothetical protein
MDELIEQVREALYRADPIAIYDNDGQLSAIGRGKKRVTPRLSCQLLTMPSPPFVRACIRCGARAE